MRALIIVITMVLSLALVRCSSHAGSAGLGAIGGAAAGAGGYEYNAHRQMQKVEEDYREGRIDKREYEIRKDQIRKGSILK